MKKLCAFLMFLNVNCVLAECRTEAQVPSSTPSSQFADNDDATVSDISTGLMWAKCSQGQSMNSCSGNAVMRTWLEALSEAQQSSLGGYSDWRLPNSKELESIVEVRCYGPSINTSVFPNTAPSYYWTATAYSNYTSGALHVNFFTGNSYPKDRSDSLYVRLVRSELIH